MANGYRDDERMPALAVDTSARTAARTTAIDPAAPRVASAATATGVSDPATLPGSVTPTNTATIATYRTVVNASEPRIPSGMLRPGSSTSSATLATFVTPAYETNTSPVAATRPPTPSPKKFA
jgi:hypothetical protein